MRGWGWIGGALLVLVGATLSAGLVGAPRSTGSEVTRAPAVVRAAVRVPRTTAGVGVTGEIPAQNSERAETNSPALERIRRDAGDGVADQIDRQRSAMRAALVLLVAGEDAQARIR